MLRKMAVFFRPQCRGTFVLLMVYVLSLLFRVGLLVVVSYSQKVLVCISLYFLCMLISFLLLFCTVYLADGPSAV